MEYHEANQPPPPPPQTHSQIQQVQLLQHAQQLAAEQAKRRARKPTDKNMPENIDDFIIGGGGQKYKELRDFERRLDAAIARKRLDILASTSKPVKRNGIFRIWIWNIVENQEWQVSNSAGDAPPASVPSYRVIIEGALVNDPDMPDDDEEKPENNKEAKDGDKPTSDSAVANENRKNNNSDMMDVDPQLEATPRKKPRIPRQISDFFRELTVEFPSHLPKTPETTVHWRRVEPPHLHPHHAEQQSQPQQSRRQVEQIRFRRTGDQNMNVTIKLSRAEDPERFLLSPALAELTGLREATVPEATLCFWEYIRALHLYEDDDHRTFRCDEVLRQVCGSDTGMMPRIVEYIHPHLRPLPALELPYTIRVDQAYHTAAAGSTQAKYSIYEIPVVVSTTSSSSLLPSTSTSAAASNASASAAAAATALLTGPAHLALFRELAALDDRLAIIVQAIQHSKARHELYSRVATDPVCALREWLASQKRDLDYIAGGSLRRPVLDATAGAAPEAWTARSRAEDAGLAESGTEAGMQHVDDMMREAVALMLSKSVMGRFV